MRAVVVAAAVVVVVLASTGAGCPHGTTKPPPPVPHAFTMPDRAVCDGTIGPTVDVAGALGDADLVEASGIVASPSHPGVLWTHNDGANGDHVYAMTTTGESLGHVKLPGVHAIDVEDIAAGPCPDLAGPCIYLADTGDNLFERPNVVVYAFAEPDVDADHPIADADTAVDAAAVWTFPIKADSGPINVEAFVVLPDATAMIFFEKQPADARIFKYQAPWTPDTLETLEVTATFTPPGPAFGGGNLPTGADIHTSGTRLVLRTYGGVFEAKLEAGLTADHLTGDDFTELFLGPASEPQGEAVGYDEDGTGIFLVSETVDGTPHPPLHHAACAGN